MRELVHFPALALFILEERLAERLAGMPIPDGFTRTEFAFRVLVAAALAQQRNETDSPTRRGGS